mgnify:FL=1
MIGSSFDADWTVTTETPGRPARTVGPATLPYDAMMFETRDPDCAAAHNTGYFPGGVYRYSKRFTAPQEWRDCVVECEFEGVYHRSHVLLNGVEVGGCPSGYTEFRVPLTGLRFGETNTIEVIVDNSQQPNSRWYTGSGIYRPVHVLVGPAVHIAPGYPQVTTRTVATGTATLDIRTDVVNAGDTDRDVWLAITVDDPSGQPVQQARRTVQVATGARLPVTQTVEIPDPALWSLRSPTLYTVRVTTAAGGRTDEAHARFGIRTVEVTAASGLLINGESTKLRGAAVHHDHGVIGAHCLPAAEHRRVRLLKEAGFNAIRSAHNPASRAMLDACDELGMLVMDELTDVWTRPKTTWDASLEFTDQWRTDLAAMIAKDINHPSVIMYSIGNEIGETATTDGIRLGAQLAATTREFDPSRPVTNCINGLLNLVASKDEAKAQSKAAKARAAGTTAANKNLILLLNLAMGAMSKIMKVVLTKPVVDRKTRDAFADVDIAGYNYMAARFRQDHLLHPDRIAVGSENPPTQTVEIWHDIADQPHVIGDFVWTGWDYLGEGAIAAARYNDRPRLFQPYPALAAGTPNFDITGHRHTQTYLNEIAWGSSYGPHLAVRPVDHARDRPVDSSWRSTDSIRSWSWAGLEGEPATVEVYGANGVAELSLNGVPVGRGQISAKSGHLVSFTVPYAPGELTAVLRGTDGTEIGRDTLRSAGPDLCLTVRAESGSLRADGHDLAFVHVEITDAEGIVRPLDDRPVSLEIDGAAALLGFGSAEPITEEGFCSPVHRTYQGRALAVLRAGHVPGQVRLTASARGCAPVDLTLTVDAAGSGSDVSV